MALVYSCCFWFSLRLGGILIAIFSLLQAALVLAGCSAAQARAHLLKDEITDLINNFNLLFAKDYLESVKNDPQKYITLLLSFTCIYIVVCLLYIYGAYTLNNMLMYAYIAVELARLALLAALLAAGLLLLKQNSMDIGLLIGASVTSGFFLLGMFYLWVCAANLPVLKNEMERDEQLATINKLQELLKASQGPLRGFDSAMHDAPVAAPYRRGPFYISNNRRSYNKDILPGSRIPYVNR